MFLKMDKTLTGFYQDEIFGIGICHKFEMGLISKIIEINKRGLFLKMLKYPNYKIYMKRKKVNENCSLASIDEVMVDAL
jgi:hypothetical protein